jgi:uncharacterized repeat protein (TIGR01451 family)
MAGCKRVLVDVWFLLLGFGVFGPAFAAAFTPGNLVIYRVGVGGATPLTNTGSAVFLDEVTPLGVLVQSIALPTTVSGVNKQLIASGVATSEGLLTRSANGNCLVLDGYAANLGGGTSLPTTTSASVPRSIGVVDNLGNINTSTALTDAANLESPRGAATTDCSTLWITGGTGGVRATTLAASTSTQLNAAATNLRGVAVQAGQLYISTGAGVTLRVATVGTGTPTTAGQTVTNLPGFPTTGSPYAFFFADLSAGVAGLDTLYVADDAAGIQKFSLVGGVWTANGTVGISADNYRGLAAVVSGSTVTLYSVRKGGNVATGGGELVSLVDSSGYNGTLTGVPTLLRTAATNIAFRGVTVTPGVPDLTIAKTHVGNFTQGQTGAQYTITVSNLGPGPTLGTVTVVDTLPVGLTATAISGTGWACVLGTLTCTRSNVLAASASYPVITLMVNVANNAPASVTNSVTVSGGGEINTGNDTATDPTTITQVADLTIAKTHSGNFIQGQTGAQYTITVSNAGPGPTSGTVTVVDTLPVGLTATAISGTGWACVLGTLTCTRSNVLAASASYPAITLTVTVANNAPASVTNSVTVSGGGEINTGNDTATDPTTIIQLADLTITKTDGVASVVPGTATTYTIVVTNNGPSGVTGATVTDAMPAAIASDTFTAVATGGATGFTASGSGNINDTVNLPAGATITYTVIANVASNATGNLTNTATVAVPPGVTDPTPGNNSSTDTDSLTPQVTLQVVKDDGATTYTPQGTAIYAITVQNTGPSDATNVTVTDVLPPGVTLSANVACATNGTSTCGTVTGAAGQATLGTTGAYLVPGGNNTIVFLVPVSFAAGMSANPLVNTATATDLSTNATASGQDSDALSPSVTLAATKEDGSATYTPGGTGTYTIIVRNTGVADALNVTVSDTFPAGMTLSANATCVAHGTSSCGTVTGTTGQASFGTTGARINAGAANPLEFTVPVAFAPSMNANPLVNAVTATDLVSGNSTTASHADTLSANVTLAVSKEDGTASYTPGGTLTYTVIVADTGLSDALNVTVSDPFPVGMTLSANATCVANGTSSCGTVTGTTGQASFGTTGARINAGAGNSLVFTVPVALSPAMTANPMINIATASDLASGTTSHANHSDVLAANVVLGFTKSDGNPTYTPGGSATYTVTVANSGLSDALNVTVSDPLPAGVTLTGNASCVAVGAASCGTVTGFTSQSAFGTTGATIAAGAGNSLVFTAPVAFAASLATNPLDNTATANDLASGASGSATDSDTRSAQADLAITKNDGVVSVVPGTTTTYAIVVTNNGPSDVIGATVGDVLPAAIVSDTFTAVGTGGASGFTASGGGNINDTVNMPAGSTITYTVLANISPAATGTLSNTATVTAPAGVTDTNPGNNSATDTDTLTPQADLAVTKTDGVASVNAGGTTIYTIVVGNAGPSNANGATFKDAAVANLNVTGVTCGSPAGGAACPTVPNTTIALMQGAGIILPTLPAGGSVTFTVNASVPSGASGSISNVATVTAPAGVTDPTPANNTASDTDTITLSADLTIAKSHSGNFTQGQTGAQYTITVSNAGPGPTAGTVTVVDTLPVGLTATAISGTGWGCVLGTLTCTRSDVLAASASYPAITLIVTVANNAPASVTNNVTVSGGGEINTGNDTATDPTTVTQVGDLTIAKTHSGSFTQGQTGAQYTITVSNLGPGPTAGTVSVVDTLPVGLTATAISGTGWGCILGTLTCTRSDVLAASGSYPAITLTVTVANNAPASVTNSVTVSGGGEINSGNDTASDNTTVGVGPDLVIAKTHAGSFTQGQIGALYTLVVTNAGATATAGTVSLVDTLPAGMTATAIGGTGWSCVLGTLTCTRGDVLAPSASYPPITLTVTVAINAPASVTNSATVGGGGDINPTNNTATDPTTITQLAGLSITKTHSGNFTAGQSGAQYTITVSNGGPGPTVGAITVTDALPAGLAAISLSGTGWACVLATLSCTRSDALAVSASYPTITLTVDVANNATSSVTNMAMVSGGGGSASSSSDVTLIGSAVVVVIPTLSESLRWLLCLLVALAAAWHLRPRRRR